MISRETVISGENQRFPSGDLAAGAGEQLRLAAAASVDRIVQVGCDLPSARWTAQWLAASSGWLSSRAAASESLVNLL